MTSVPDTGNSSVNRPAFPVPDDDGAAKHLIAGTRLPDVALVATRQICCWAELLDQVELRGDERILDIGCGEARCC